ncbi:MAG: hypothetical protein ACT6SG_20390, partial [Hydrogenophaga sp.]|uniref:hypothetical protein n=1 Tax=Hydrogenophaga sp. TaxID=1904254 RepID=UPI00403660F9
LIIGKDFKFILSPDDKVGTPVGSTSQHAEDWVGSRGVGAEQLERLVEERGLVDAWRRMRPTSRDFTHAGRQGPAETVGTF